MSDTSKIEWTDASWNPVRGCTKVSPGCAHCYADTFAERFRGVKGHPYEQGFDLRLVPEKLTEPLRWKKPRRVFVNSMSDLFQDGVPWSFIDQALAVMALTPQHTYQILTKRSAEMRDYIASPDRSDAILDEATDIAHDRIANTAYLQDTAETSIGRWPLPNVWLGVSVENQHFADERIPLLLETPAAVRFISAEPLLGHVSLKPFIGGSDTAEDDLGPEDAHCVRCGCVWEEDVTHECPPGFGPRLDWVIVGGESGPGARPFEVAWARSIVAQCQAAGVACFVKQLGAHPIGVRSRTELAAGAGVECEHGYNVCPRCDAGTIPLRLRDRKGGDLAEWPPDLRVREFPR